MLALCERDFYDFHNLMNTVTLLPARSHCRPSFWCSAIRNMSLITI